MKFKMFQLHDYAAAAMADGLVLAHDTGLGKSLAAVTWPLLKCGFSVSLAQSSRIQVKGSVLIVAPGDLHDQLRVEFKKFYGIVPVSIDDQQGLSKLLVNRRLPHGFYLTSYTRLAVNGVRKISAIEKSAPELAIAELNLNLSDLQRFYDQRGDFYKNDYATLGVEADCTAKQLDRALAAKTLSTRNWSNPEAAQRHRAELGRCHALLVNFLGPFAPVAFHLANAAVKFIWRELINHKLAEYAAGVGEIRTGIKCVYSPSVADLCSHLFDCVVIDEGVKMKGSDTQVGRGIRQMCPRYRLVLTATPVKNRLPDIFWLAWWAAGGHEEATARWPYAGGAEEQEKFASTFMLSEFNKSKARKEGGARSRFTKLRPEICNLHLLWKALGPIVLRRRKQDIGQSIVQKIRHVYRVPMGLHQRAVYRYHLESAYLDCNLRPAPGAKLQALRVAAAAPDSHLLDPQPGGEDRVCCGQADPFGGICRRCGSPPLAHRSQHSFTPKVACALTLIRDILRRGEQAAVFSAFNNPSDILSRYLSEAGVDHFLLDGRTIQSKRGLRSAAFNNGECPITLAGIDSMAEGHNWDNVSNIILTSYTWAADKVIQAINRAHRLTSKRDVNLYVIICEQSADRVLEDNINEKTNASELAIDGRLLGESTQEKSIGELLREAARDFLGTQVCPNEEELRHTWPVLRQSLQDAADCWTATPRPKHNANPDPLIVPIFPLASLRVPLTASYLPPWRRARCEVPS
ncbi:MAG TPA: SNF2-related protein [Verrucomicrobiae bacterium]|jgi:SNF2 family DNA or RNA helicase|nr:SNF2-related protein [Verrucomicrobiae bacterium]